MNFCGKGEGEYEASNRVVCGSRQVSVCEMWERKQIFEDARKMYKEGVAWEDGEDVNWSDVTGICCFCLGWQLPHHWVVEWVCGSVSSLRLWACLPSIRNANQCLVKILWMLKSGAAR